MMRPLPFSRGLLRILWPGAFVAMLAWLIGLTMPARAACIAPPSGLVSWWSGDDNAYDLKGFNHGVLRFGASYTNGLVGRAFSFDGTSNLVQTTTWGMNIGALDFSIVGWAKTTATNSKNALLMFDFYSPALYITGPNGGLQLFPAPGTTNVGFNDGVFHHFAVTRLNGGISYYKDGVLIGTNVYTDNISQDRFLIGSDNIQPFKGAIDEVAFFERALTAAEVQSIVAAGIDGMCKPAALPSPSFFIEAEDFDFNGGQHKAEADSMPYLGGAYAGLSATVEIDYHDPGTNENAAYRPASQAVAISGSSDLYRDGYQLINNYKVGWNDPGDWYNYTRVFPSPARNYNIYARLSGGDSAFSNAIQLDEVVSGAGTTNQTVSKIGEAHGPASGSWDYFFFVPVLDSSGNLATVTYGGQKTVRVTILPGGQEDFNYLVFVPVDPPSSNACIASPSGQVAWWSGDGHPRDLQGANHGTLKNGATYTTGKVAEGFLFDGVDDYVDTALDVQPSAMPSTTWECWVYPTVADPSRREILSCDDGSYDRTIGVEASTFSVFVGFGVWYPIGITPNRWQHIAVVYTPNNVEFYKNGVRFSFNAAPTGGATANKLNIGRNPGFGEYFQGRIDEVGIYNRALTAAEIQSIYNAGSAGRCKPVVCPDITVSPSTLSTGLVGTVFSQTFSGANGVGPYVFSLAGGSLPPSLTLSSNGLLSGTLMSTGSFAFSLRVTDSNGCSKPLNYSLTVVPRALPCTNLPAGLVSWWRAEGNAEDAIGLNTSTALFGTTFAPGKVGQAFSFDGGTNLINVPTNGLNVRTNDFTLEGWLQTTTPASYSAIFDYDYYSPALFLLGGGQLLFWQDSSSFASLVGGFNDGQFHHFAIVRQGPRIAYYKDGVSAGMVTNSFTMDVNGQTILIGKRLGGEPYQGLIDELSFYNRALTAGEIAQIFGAGSAGKCGGTVVTTNAPGCPTVSSINPTNGAVGDNVTITGTNFTGVTAVKFASNVAATFTVVNDMTITTTVPTNAASGVITISKTGCTDAQTGAFTIGGGGSGGTPELGFGRAGALTLNAGENSLLSGVIDTNAGFAYFATYTSPGIIVKVRLSDFTRVGALPLNAGENLPDAAVIDTAGGFAYFITDTSPGIVVKVRLSDFTRVGAPTLNSGESRFYNSAVIDPGAGFIYLGAIGSPGKIVKVRLSDFTRVGVLTLNSGEDSPASAAIDPSGGFAYFATFTSPARVVKVRLSDFTRVGALTLNSGEDRPARGLLDPTAGFAYFSLESGPGRVVKIQLSDFTRVGVLTFNTNEDTPDSGVFDPVAGRAYFGAYASPGKVMKVRLSDFSRVASVTLNTGEDSPACAVIDPGARFAYFGTATVPGRIVKIDLAIPVCPAITSINPTNGAVGSSVTITGTNLTGVTAVRFANNVPATTFTVVNNTTITATVPSGAVTGAITISKANCTDAPAGTFTVNVVGSCTPAPAGLIAWYRAENSFTNSLGGNNGIPENGTTFGAGEVGQAFSFDGVAADVLLPAMNVGSSFTVELWLFAIDGVTRWQHLVSDGEYDTKFGSLFFDADRIIYYQNGNRWIETALNTVTLSNWTHVALTYDGSTATVFINGTKSNGALNVAPVVFNNALKLGYSNDALDNHFKGLLDEVSIYNRALNPSEIAAIFAAGGAGKCGTGGTTNVPGCPTVSSINPTSGAVGSSVTITGTNLTGVTAVKFTNNVAATFTVTNDTTITAMVPTGAVTGAITISKTNCPGAQTGTFTVGTTNVSPQSSMLVAWGENVSGQLGYDGGSTTLPISVNTTGALAGKIVIALAAGNYHSIALTSDGKVFGWGLNAAGQVGDGTHTNRFSPVPVIDGVLAGRTVTAIASGWYHNLALASDGTLYAWGDNSNGALGTEAGNNSVPSMVTTSGALNGKTVIAIAAGGYHSVALTSDRRLYAWGTYGIGSATTDSTSVPVAVEMTGALNGKTVVAIAAGFEHSLALTTEGKVYSWGYNDSGQLGITNWASFIPAPVLSGAMSGKFITAIAAGQAFSLAQASDGTLFSWGANDSGQLGNGGSSGAGVPVAVNMSGTLNGKQALHLKAGNAHALMIASDGKLYSWGINSSGELGIGPAPDSNVPVAVNTNGILAGKTLSAIAAGFRHNLAIIGSPPAPPPILAGLAAQFNGSTLTLSWSAALNMQLEAASSLSSPVQWAIVTNQPVVVGDQKTVTLPPAGSSRFFRLVSE